MSVHLSEHDGLLDITALIGWPQRCVYGALALVPLLAPYELILGVAWRSYWNPFFVFAAAVSVGALVVSALLMLIALGGRDRRTTIDTKAGRVSFVEWSPVGRDRTRAFPVGALRSFDVRTHGWTDGDSYSLDFHWAGGPSFAVASSLSREEIEGCRATVAAFLQRH